jgi:hypothetical protein
MPICTFHCQACSDPHFRLSSQASQNKETRSERMDFLRVFSTSLQPFVPGCKRGEEIACPGSLPRRRIGADTAKHPPPPPGRGHGSPAGRTGCSIQHKVTTLCPRIFALKLYSPFSPSLAIPRNHTQPSFWFDSSAPHPACGGASRPDTAVPPDHAQTAPRADAARPLIDRGEPRREAPARCGAACALRVGKREALTGLGRRAVAGSGPRRSTRGSSRA